MSNVEAIIRMKEEIFNLYRVLKFNQCIVDNNLNINKSKYKYYFLWIHQTLTPKLIAIDAYKFNAQLGGNIVDIIKKLLPNNQKQALIKESKFQHSLDLLRNCTAHLENWRHNIFAHIDNNLIPDTTCDSLEIMIALSNIYNSIEYILFFIKKNIHDIQNLFEISDVTIETLEESIINKRIEDDDPIFNDFKLMIEFITQF